MKNTFTLPALLVTAGLFLIQSLVPFPSTAHVPLEQPGGRGEQTTIPVVEWGNPLAGFAVTPGPTSYNENEQAASLTAMAVFSVTNANDGGPGSLRQAIVNANESIGPDEITFNIGLGAQTIRLLSPLPEITDPLNINGVSQPTSFVTSSFEAQDAGDQVVELDGSNAGAGANALTITAGNSVVKGLAIGNFNGHAISLQQRGSNTIMNNNLGTDATGQQDRGNAGEGVNVLNSNNNTVTSNIIVFNADGGSLINSNGNVVRGNILGTNKTLTRNMGNRGAGFGFADSFDNRFESNRVSFNRIGFFGFGGGRNTFGSTDPRDGNLITRNETGVSLNNSNDNVFQACFFGTNSALVDDQGNLLAAIELRGTSSNNRIGGAQVSAGNVIAFNRVAIDASSGTSSNLFLFNQIFSNTEQSIRLESGANRGLPAPNLTSAAAENGQTIIRGTFNGSPGLSLAVQYTFGGKSSPPEGKIPLGSRTVTTNGLGQADVSVTVPFTVPGGSFITALATNLATNDTSAYSNPVPVTGTAKPDLKVEKSGPETVKCGETITYTMTVTNVGNAPALRFYVTDTLPPCISGEAEVTTSQADTFTYAQIENNVATLVPRLDPGASMTITVQVTVTEECQGTILNKATGVADGDTNSSNNVDDAATKVECVNITGVRREGKHAFVTGVGFQKGDEVDINGVVGRVAKLQEDGSLKVKKGGKDLLTCDSANPGRTNVIKLIRRSNVANPIMDTSAFDTCP